MEVEGSSEWYYWLCWLSGPNRVDWCSPFTSHSGVIRIVRLIGVKAEAAEYLLWGVHALL